MAFNQRNYMTDIEKETEKLLDEKFARANEYPEIMASVIIPFIIDRYYRVEEEAEIDTFSVVICCDSIDKIATTLIEKIHELELDIFIIITSDIEGSIPNYILDADVYIDLTDEWENDYFSKFNNQKETTLWIYPFTDVPTREIFLNAEHSLYIISGEELREPFKTEYLYQLISR